MSIRVSDSSTGLDTSSMEGLGEPDFVIEFVMSLSDEPRLVNVLSTGSTRNNVPGNFSYPSYSVDWVTQCEAGSAGKYQETGSLNISNSLAVQLMKCPLP